MEAQPLHIKVTKCWLNHGIIFKSRNKWNGVEKMRDIFIWTPHTIFSPALPMRLGEQPLLSHCSTYDLLADSQGFPRPANPPSHRPTQTGHLNTHHFLGVKWISPLWETTLISSSWALNEVMNEDIKYKHRSTDCSLNNYRQHQALGGIECIYVRASTETRPPDSQTKLPSLMLMGCP